MKKGLAAILCVVLVMCLLTGTVSAFANDWETDPIKCLDHSFTLNYKKPASAKEDGYTAKQCSRCGQIDATSKVVTPRIASVRLSQTTFYYSGTEKKPVVTAIDRTGKTISSKYYKVTYYNNVKVGKKTYANIVFSGPYKEAYNRYFDIYLGKPTVSIGTSASAVKLSWNKVPGAQYYRVYAFNTATQKYSRLVSTASLTYTIKNLKAGTKYVYLVRAYFINAAKKEVLSPYTTADNVTAYTRCASPSVKASVSGKNVTLTWDKVPGAKYYRVFRYDTKTKSYITLINNYTSLSYVAQNQPTGTDYYLVRAFNMNSEGSAYSTDILAKAIVR